MTVSGLLSMGTWEELTSTVVAPARLAIARSARGEIVLSCDATMYQLGIVFHAGTPDGVPNAARAAGR